MKRIDQIDTPTIPHAPRINRPGNGGVDFETVLTTAAIASAAGLKFVLEMVRLWVETRKDRRIKIKRGDVEMELQGTMSDKDIAATIEHFERLARNENDSEVEIQVEV
jgi:hypothetical protein